MYLLVYVRLLQSIDILTQIVFPGEARDLAVGAASEHVYACEEQGGAIKFKRCDCVQVESGSPNDERLMTNDAVQRVNFVVKLLRAHGGCLGRRRR
jgi:hypothetical protein